MFSQSQKSFTMIELLIVMAVTALLVGMAVVSYRTFEQNTKLEREAQNIISALKSAQNKTTASEEASQYGLHFENNRYILFKGSGYQEGAPDNKIYPLASNIEISSISLAGAGSDVVFSRINGQTAQTGTIELRIASQPDKTRIVCIASFIINLCSSPDNLPNGSQTITKSRHVHFMLNWSIQDATLLKFNFILSDQIETIEMPPFFNSGKKSFDWEGEFIVGGSGQKYHIHTHRLNATETILCIHRDGFNNEEVIISITDASLDKEIVQYFNDGTGVVGPYGGTAEEQ